MHPHTDLLRAKGSESYTSLITNGMLGTCDRHQRTSNHVFPWITGIKKRVRTHREQRGGIPAKGNLGDKPYKKVDHCPGIQQAGEFIVGSSFYRSVELNDGGNVMGHHARVERSTHLSIGTSRLSVGTSLTFQSSYPPCSHRFRPSIASSKYVPTIRIQIYTF